MHHLDRIQIAGFKSIRDQTVELRPLNVLIGANGAGKSNFVQVFRLLHELVNQNFQVFVARSGGADRLLHFGAKTTEEIFVNVDFGPMSYYCRLLSSAGDSLVFAEERIWDRGPNVSAVDRMGRRESLLGDATSALGRLNMAYLVTPVLRGWKVYHFHDTSASARIKQTGDLSDNAALRSDAGNLAAFLYRLQETEPGTFRNIVDTIRLVAPFFGKFDLRPDRLNPDKIKLEWREEGADTYFDASSLSDGTLRFICLATLLLQPDSPATILIDEPELGLHPFAINVLADLFRSAAERTQIIVSTQSVTLVNQLSPEDVIVVDRERRESVFRRPSSTELESWLDGYSLGELWEKNVLGGRPTP